MSTQSDVSPKQLAEQVAEMLSKGDKVSRQLGIERLDVGPGYASMALTVDDTMTNGHDICHSGIIFTLADISCAYAACSHNENNLAQSLQIQLMTPAKVGMRLLSHAREVGTVGRSGVYDIEITDDARNQIALVRSQCRKLRGAIAEGLPMGR